MGDRLEVYAWLPQPQGGYDYVQVYGGRSFIAAIRAVIAAKRTAGCVKFEWR
jgi:hypothetical protein